MQVAAYSCQSDKMINSGEGGFLTTNDEQLFAKAIYMSGCYEARYGTRIIVYITSVIIHPHFFF